MTKRPKRNYLSIQIGSHIIISKYAIEYMVVMKDTKLSYNQYVQNFCDKASTTSVVLARTMVNV